MGIYRPALNQSNFLRPGLHELACNNELESNIGSSYTDAVSRSLVIDGQSVNHTQSLALITAKN